jgi:hypothetical protein
MQVNCMSSLPRPPTVSRHWLVAIWVFPTHFIRRGVHLTGLYPIDTIYNMVRRAVVI